MQVPKGKALSKVTPCQKVKKPRKNQIETLTQKRQGCPKLPTCGRFILEIVLEDVCGLSQLLGGPPQAGQGVRGRVAVLLLVDGHHLSTTSIGRSQIESSSLKTYRVSGE